MVSGLEIGPVRSSEMTNNLRRTSSVPMSLSYLTSAPGWQLLGRTSDIFGKDWSIFQLVVDWTSGNLVQFRALGVLKKYIIFLY